MCGSSPQITATTNTETKKDDVVKQKQADASSTKADATTQTSSQEARTGKSENTTLGTAGSRNKQTGLAGRDVKTSPRGLNDTAFLQKKSLLGA